MSLQLSEEVPLFVSERATAKSDPKSNCSVVMLFAVVSSASC